MKLLAGTHYDPGTAATKGGGSALAMTAIDTTNLRLVFTAPSNGSVLVRQRMGIRGNSATVGMLFGVLSGATVVCRQAPMISLAGAASTSQGMGISSMVVTGLTPGTSYTWDAAYGVEVAGGGLSYGGPDDATTNNAWGGIAYEIYDTPGLLASVAYDPTTADQSKVLSGLLAVTALDTTNLRLTFTAPSRGVVMVRLRGVVTGTTVVSQSWMWCVLDGATVRFRQNGVGQRQQTTAAASDMIVREATGLVTGLTGGTSYTWDAAYAVDIVQASSTASWGGPNDTTLNNAWGQYAFDVWNVDDLPRAIGGAV